jgi:hypothetical protein
MKRPKKTKVNRLKFFDYDFRGVPDSELEGCELYEYARESRMVRDKVEEIKHIGAEMIVHRPLLATPHSARKRNFLICLSSCSFFPYTPWQELSGGDKQRIFEYIESVPRIERNSATNPSLLFSSLPVEFDGATLKVWKESVLYGLSDKNTFECGFYAIDVKHDRNDLVERFKDHLDYLEAKYQIKKTNAELGEIKRERRGRHTPRDPLRRLGAMRLFYYFPDINDARCKMVRIVPGQIKSSPTEYADQNGYSRANDLALRHFQSLLGWIDSGRPIHFKWAKRRKNTV